MTTPYGTSGSLTSGYHVPNISPLLQFHGKVYLLVKESLNLGVQMHSPEIIEACLLSLILLYNNMSRQHRPSEDQGLHQETFLTDIISNE